MISSCFLVGIVVFERENLQKVHIHVLPIGGARKQFEYSCQ